MGPAWPEGQGYAIRQEANANNLNRFELFDSGPRMARAVQVVNDLWVAWCIDTSLNSIAHICENVEPTYPVWKNGPDLRGPV